MDSSTISAITPSKTDIALAMEVDPSSLGTKTDYLISTAVIRLGAAVPQLETADESKLDLAKNIVTEAVLRVLRNPGAAEGYSGETEGDYSYQIQSALAASADVWFPDKDLALLRGTSLGIGTIMTHRVGRDCYGAPRPW